MSHYDDPPLDETMPPIEVIEKDAGEGDSK